MKYYLSKLYICNWPLCSLQNAESNAEYKGLDADHLIIEHIQVSEWVKMIINKILPVEGGGIINSILSSAEYLFNVNFSQMIQNKTIK